MKTPKFVGRKKELNLLKSYMSQKTSSFVVMHGRRRIGKSRLIEEFAKDQRYYSFTGLAPGPKITAKTQREEFARKLGHYFNIPGLKATDWADLFSILASQCPKGPVVILLDEISWMGMKDPTFLSKLRNAWDQEFKKIENLLFVVCGSISSWIEKNILSSTGFLGRVNHVIVLDELPLKECNEFWNSRQNIAFYEKLKYLAVVGGIPLYLEAMNPKQTAEENIHRLCFTAGGLLVREFNNIFSDLFSKRSELYIKIIRTLVNGAAEIAEICEKMGIKQTGWLTQHLKDLEQSGFIRREYAWHLASGRDANISHYRLSDNYVRFYLKYIEKNIKKIERNEFDHRSLSSLPGWYSILGFQFENLVLKNRVPIKESLGIQQDEIIAEGPFFQKKTSKQKGCQIDYLIQTKFNNLYVCEIKFSKTAIGMEIIDEVQEKLSRLKKPKGFSFRPVLIHVNGVSEDLEESDFFYKMICSDELFN
jgi:AAA+ ATPase superfamily predicted ATPase